MNYFWNIKKIKYKINDCLNISWIVGFKTINDHNNNGVKTKR